MKQQPLSQSEKTILTVLAVVLMLALMSSMTSCSSRYVTVDQAASGKARCGKWLR